MGTVTPADMEVLIGTHMLAEENGDPQRAVSVYTEDVEHDVVGFPGDPIRGVDAALDRYHQLVKDLRVEKAERTHTYYADDAAITEDFITAVVTGQFMGIPGNNRRITFRMLHVFEFKEGKISRENVWLDGGSIAAQLTTPA